MTDSVGGTVPMAEDELALSELYPLFRSDCHDVILVINEKVGIAAFEQTDDAATPDRRMSGLSGNAVLDALRSRERSLLGMILPAVDPKFDITDRPFDCYLRNLVSQEELTGAIRGLLSLDSNTTTVREYYRRIRNRVTGWGWNRRLNSQGGTR